MAIILRSIDNIYGLSSRLDAMDVLDQSFESRISELEKTFFKQPTAPTDIEGRSVGDIWYDTLNDTISVYREYPSGSLTYSWTELVFNDTVDNGAYIVQTTSEEVFDTIDMTTFRSADYLISYDDGSNILYGSSKISVYHNGTIVNHTQYGIIGDDYCTFNVVVNGTLIEMRVTTNQGVKVSFTKVLTLLV